MSQKSSTFAPAFEKSCYQTSVEKSAFRDEVKVRAKREGEMGEWLKPTVC